MRTGPTHKGRAVDACPSRVAAATVSCYGVLAAQRSDSLFETPVGPSRTLATLWVGPTSPTDPTGPTGLSLLVCTSSRSVVHRALPTNLPRCRTTAACATHGSAVQHGGATKGMRVQRRLLGLSGWTHGKKARWAVDAPVMLLSAGRTSGIKTTATGSSTGRFLYARPSRIRTRWAMMRWSCCRVQGGITTPLGAPKMANSHGYELANFWRCPVHCGQLWGA